MTLQQAIIAARRRVLRPEGYQQVAGAVLAFLIIVVALRFGANIYIGRLLLALNFPDGVTAANRTVYERLVLFFARANLSWCVLFLASAAPLIAYRGVAQTVRNERMGHFPLTGRRLLGATAGASLRGLPALVPLGLIIVVWALFLQPPLAAHIAEPALFLAAGVAAFLALLSLAWYLRAERRRLELIELGVFVGLILMNPDFRIVSGEPRLLLANSSKMGVVHSGLLFALPFIGAAVTAAALLLSESLAGRRTRRPGRRRRAGLTLYRSRIPLRLFVLTYLVELPIILANPLVGTVVRNTVLLLLGLRILWFLVFVFRTEQEIGKSIGAPWKLSDRLPLYRPAACVHALLCAAPVLLYLGRVVAR